MDTSLHLPNEVPVMPVPGAVLFPHALMPLYIFEPRYRVMLQQALDRDRMFCVALVKPHLPQWQSTPDFFDVAGLGLIRACVGRSDGTSNLILQGLQRVRFVEFSEQMPFPVAQVEYLNSDTPLSVETEALGAKVLELYGRLKGNGRELPEKVDRYLSDLHDPEMLADLVASTFISEPVRRQHILAELDITQRLRVLVQYLREEGGSAAA
jgi:Lon protease-like protein